MENATMAVTRDQLKKGDKVYFGRGRGEQTLGEVVKLNEKKAKIKTLERRGANHPAGQEWGVPYSMIRFADKTAEPTKTSAPPPVERVQAVAEPLTYSPFTGNDNLILEAIVGVYDSLSPENLSGDGELPITTIRRRRADLERRLRGLTLALGREVSEDQAYEWWKSKVAFNDADRQRKAANS